MALSRLAIGDCACTLANSSPNPQNFFESYPGADLSPLTRLVCGGVAGITSVTFTYPLDIVRTRLSIQSASFASLKANQSQHLPGMWGTLTTMYKTEGGIKALYRGIVPTVAGVAPYVSGCFPSSQPATLALRMDHLTDRASLGRSQFHDI